MMLRHDGKINCIMIGEVLHIVRMPLRAIVYLAHASHLYRPIIMESQLPADNIDNFAVLLMAMDA